MSVFRAMSVVTWAVIGWAVLALALDLPRVKIAVEHGHWQRAPATLRMRVTVEPREENRRLRVVAESAEYYQSADEQLEGADSPRTRTVEFRDCPGGEYVLHALVETAEGRTYGARDTVTIVDPPR